MTLPELGGQALVDSLIDGKKRMLAKAKSIRFDARVADGATPIVLESSSAGMLMNFPFKSKAKFSPVLHDGSLDGEKFFSF